MMSLSDAVPVEVDDLAERMRWFEVGFPIHDVGGSCGYGALLFVIVLGGVPFDKAQA